MIAQYLVTYTTDRVCCSVLYKLWITKTNGGKCLVGTEDFRQFCRGGCDPPAEPIQDSEKELKTSRCARSYLIGDITNGKNSNIVGGLCFFFFFLRLSTPKRESSHLCLYSHPYQQRAAQHLWHHLHSRFFFFSLLLITFSFAGCWDKYVKMVISWEYTRRVCCIIVRIIRTRPKGENAHQLLNVVDRELIGPLLFVVAQEDGAFVFFLFFSIANHWSNVGGSSFSCLFYFEEMSQVYFINIYCCHINT